MTLISVQDNIAHNLVAPMQTNRENLSDKHRKTTNYSRRKNSEEIYAYHRSRTVYVELSEIWKSVMITRANC